MSKFKAVLAKLFMEVVLKVEGIRIGELDGKYYLFRKKSLRYFGDLGIRIAVIQCLKICSIKIPIIITDELFDMIVGDDKVMEDFIYRHEIAHYQLNHFEKDISILTHEELFNLEIEADSYAASRVGYKPALDCLTNLDEFIKRELDLFDESLPIRKNMIKEKIETA